MIWENYLFEKICVFDFSKLALVCKSMVWISYHCRHGMSIHLGYHSNYDLKIYTINFHLLKLPGHQSLTLQLQWQHSCDVIRTASRAFGTYRLCEQRRFRRACASAQSRQNLRCSLIQAVSQEEPSDRKPDPWPLWMAGHAQLKLVMMECSKTQIRLMGLIPFLQWYETHTITPEYAILHTSANFGTSKWLKLPQINNFSQIN